MLEENGDHATDQKAHSEKQRLHKEKVIQEDMGQKRLLSLGFEAIFSTMQVENQQKITDAGGEAAWSLLSVNEQVKQDINMMKRLTICLGKEELACMPEYDRRKLMLFIWAGCSMHKELNTVKCGNKPMMAWWKNNNIPGPVPLANRNNAATL